VSTPSVGLFVTGLGGFPARCGQTPVRVGVKTRPEVDPRSGLGLDADPVRRMIEAPGTVGVVGVAVFFTVSHGRLAARVRPGCRSFLRPARGA
jgi:hypothetical protein